jgi:ABC-type cobalt transport system substrate-binding protein
MSNIRSRRRRRLAVILAVAAAFALTAYAFTASNTFADANNKAGDGSQTITGYQVSNIEYQLQAPNAAYIDSVSFDLNADAGEVKVKLVSTGSTYTNCTGGPTAWTCDFAADSQTVVSANEFRVVAVQ